MRPNDRPIFVVGCPRSGTTLFRTMLHAHPSIAIPPETRFLMSMYWRRTEYGDLRNRSAREALARAIVDDPETRFRFVEIDGPTVIKEIVEEGTTFGSAVGIVFRDYSRKFDKPRWGDKRPSYYAFMDELDNLFPDAQFIHLVRDPRACVESLKRMDWYADDADSCTAAWLHAVRSARKSGTRLGPSRYLEVRYEDLVSDPEAVTRRVCDFLGEPFSAEMVRPEEIADKVNPAHYQQRQQIQEGVNTGTVDAWVTRLPPEEIALVERVARRWMQEFGYQPSPAAGRASAWHVFRAIRLHRGYGRRLTERRLQDRRRMTYADNPIAARLTSEQRRLAVIPRPLTRGQRALRAVRPLIGPPTRPIRKSIGWIRWHLRHWGESTESS